MKACVSERGVCVHEGRNSVFRCYVCLSEGVEKKDGRKEGEEWKRIRSETSKGYKKDSLVRRD